MKPKIVLLIGIFLAFATHCHAVLGSGGGVITGIDDGVVPVIEKEHYEVHEGDFYSATSVDSNITTPEAHYWMFVAPDTSARIHLNASISADGAGLIYLYAEGTVSDSGVAIIPINNDRNSTNLTTARLYNSPAITTKGNLLMASYFGANNNKTQFGGSAKNNAEYILKQGKVYIIEYLPDTDGKTAVLVIEFYEE